MLPQLYAEEDTPASPPRRGRRKRRTDIGRGVDAEDSRRRNHNRNRHSTNPTNVNEEDDEDDDVKTEVGPGTRRNFIDLSKTDDEEEIKVKIEEVSQEYNYIVWKKYEIRSGIKRKYHLNDERLVFGCREVKYHGKEFIKRAGATRWICTYIGCGKTYATCTTLWEHIVKIHWFKGDKQWVCLFDDCDQWFDTRPGTIDHIKRIHMKEQWECKSCHKKCQNAMAARRCAKKCQGGTR